MEQGVKYSGGADTGFRLLSFIVALFAIFTLEMSNLGWTALASELPKVWHISPGQFGFLLGLGGPALIVVGLPGGWFVKQWGEKQALIIGAILAALGLLLIGLASGFTLGVVGRIVWQLGYGIAFIASLTAVTKSAPARWRGSTMGIFGGASAVAAAFGAPFVSLISDSHGWQSGFYTFAIMGVIGILAVAFLYKSNGSVSVEPAAHRQPESKQNAKSAYKVPMVWILALSLALSDIMGLIMIFYGPTVLEQVYHASVLSASGLITGGFLLSIPINLLAGYIADRVNRFSVVGGILILLIIGALCLTIPNEGVFRIVAMLLLALGFSIPNISMSIAADLLAGREVGPIMGVMNFGIGFAVYFGPQLIGSLDGATGGFNTGWYTLAALMVLSFLFLLYARAASRKHMDEMGKDDKPAAAVSGS